MKNTSNLNTSNYQGQNNLQQNIFPRKSLEELDMMDAFLFEAATEDVENAKKIARIIIERATGHKVENLIVETQKQLKGINVDKRGIRMDIYTTEKDKEENGGRTIQNYFPQTLLLKICRMLLLYGFYHMTHLVKKECYIPLKIVW